MTDRPHLAAMTDRPTLAAMTDRPHLVAMTDRPTLADCCTPIPSHPMCRLTPALTPAVPARPSRLQANRSNGSDVTIQQLQWGPVQMYNTTLTCVASAATSPQVTLAAASAQQLLWGIQVLGQLQPSTIILTHDMAVPADSWPKGLMLNRSMVMGGLPPPAPRTVLDLYQVGTKWAQSGAGGHQRGSWVALKACGCMAVNLSHLLGNPHLNPVPQSRPQSRPQTQLLMHSCAHPLLFDSFPLGSFLA